MRYMRRFCGIVLALLNVFLYTTVSIHAEEELTFPTTAEEIIEALSGETPASKKSWGGLQTSSNNNSDLFGRSDKQGMTRGLAAIVEDERELEQAPKVGALILFEYNSSDIQEVSLPLLREYGKALKGALRDAIFVLGGHTDSKGSEEYNLMLSERRAESVKTFLVAEYQISERQLIVKPYGEVRPIKSNSTSEGRALNRRVEFIRIK